jgi:hypothetical protein
MNTASIVGDRVRQAAETVHPALIEAELTEAIDAAPHERSAERSAQRNGHRARILTTTAVIWSCGFRRCAPGRSSRHCSSGAGEWIRHCSPW